jgi:hypothetical protein
LRTTLFEQRHSGVPNIDLHVFGTSAVTLSERRGLLCQSSNTAVCHGTALQQGHLLFADRKKIFLFYALKAFIIQIIS